MRIGVINRVPLLRAPINSWTPSDANVTLISSYPLQKNQVSNIKNFIYFKEYDDDSSLTSLILKLDLEEHFDCLITLSEFDILRVSKIRSLLGIKGQNYFSGQIFRNKIKMKKFARSRGLLVPKYGKVSSIYDIQKFVRINGYPCILKPTNESSSKDVFVLNENFNLDSKKLEDKLNKYGIMDIERYIKGKLYQVDGIVNNHELQFVSISQCLNNLGESTTLTKESKPTTIADFTIDDSSKEFKKLKAQATMLLKDSYLNCGSVHIEFIIDENNDPYFIEVGSRTGGLMVSDIIERKYGIVMNEASYKLQAGFPYELSPNIPKIESGFISILPQEGILTKFDISKINPLVSRIDKNYQIGKTYGMATESTDHIALLQFEAKNDIKIKNKIAKINQLILNGISWQ